MYIYINISYAKPHASKIFLHSLYLIQIVPSFLIFRNIFAPIFWSRFFGKTRRRRKKEQKKCREHKKDEEKKRFQLSFSSFSSAEMLEAHILYGKRWAFNYSYVCFGVFAIQKKSFIFHCNFQLFDFSDSINVDKTVIAVAVAWMCDSKSIDLYVYAMSFQIFCPFCPVLFVFSLFSAVWTV